MSRPSGDPSHMELLRYYRDRVSTLESRLEYLEQLVSELSPANCPEAQTILTPENFNKINDIVETMIHTTDKQKIYDLIVEGIEDIFGFQRMSILEIEDEELHVVSNTGLPDEYVDNLVIPVENKPGKDHRSVLARCASRGETIVIEDRSDCEVYNQREKEKGKTYSHQFLGIPIVTFGETIGVFTVAVARDSEYFLNERTVNVLNFFVNQSAAALENQRLTKRREKNYQNTVTTLVSAVEAKDETTGDHARRLRQMADDLGGFIGLSNQQLRELKWGAILHDIGKIGTDGQILRKEGPLTDEEFEEIKQHPRRGYEILKHLDFINGARDIVLYHHERWDGTGYPEGLAEDEIPKLARVLNLIDSYDVMIHARPYKPAMKPEEAVAEVINCSGEQFDPNLVDPFFRTLPSDIVKKGKKIAG